MEIIKERKLVKEEIYEINFFLKETKEVRTGYICNENGEILKDKITPEAYANYLKDLENPNFYHRICHYTRNYHEDAVGRCVCGKEIELYNQYMGACQCPNCGQWYNVFGQMLIPPAYWED